MKKRLVWADILRILAIYLVVSVHSSSLPNTSFLSTLQFIILFAIAKTCVPLFFMLSGALLLPKVEPTSYFIKKRFLRIFIPYIFWAFILIVYLFFYQLPHTPIEMIKIVATGLRGFWFLPILYILYSLTPSLRVYVQHEKKVQLLLPLAIWFILLCFLPYVRNTAAFPIQSRNDILSQVVDYSGYFLLGYFIIASNYFKTKKVSFILIIIGLLWSISGTLYLYSKQHTVDYLYFAYISPSDVILSLGIFSLFLNMEKTFTTWNVRIKNIVAQISNLIFGVYLLLSVTVQIFNRINFTIPHTQLPVIVDIPIVAFIFFVSMLFIVFLLSKIPVVNRVIT